jgi:hypothetical protein
MGARSPRRKRPTPIVGRSRRTPPVTVEAGANPSLHRFVPGRLHLADRIDDGLYLVAQTAYDFTLDCTRANRLLGYRPYREYPEAIEALAGRTSCVL